MRALAVLAVVSYHCINPSSIWSRVALRGHLGVEVFFAISGFLICGRLLQELRETISLRTFYLRRCCRILPPVCAYLAILAIFTAAGWAKVGDWEFGSTLLFVRNYYPLFHAGVLGCYTAQFWSLGVEEHFYVVWPVAMLLLGPKIRRIGWAALILALGVFLWRTINRLHGWLIPFGWSVDSKTDTRIDALIWGVCAQSHRFFNPDATPEPSLSAAGLYPYQFRAAFRRHAKRSSVLLPNVIFMPKRRTPQDGNR